MLAFVQVQDLKNVQNYSSLKCSVECIDRKCTVQISLQIFSNFFKSCSEEEAVQWLEQHQEFTYLTNSDTEKGHIDYYRCGLVKRKFYSGCPVRAKIEFMSTNELVNIYVSTYNHDHEHISEGEKMPPSMKQEIIKYHQNGVKPKDILHCMEESHGLRFHFDITNVRNVIRYNTDKTVIKTVDVGELIAWVNTKRLTPKDLDESNTNGVYYQ